jgi:hypothetical protein
VHEPTWSGRGNGRRRLHSFPVRIELHETVIERCSDDRDSRGASFGRHVGESARSKRENIRGNQRYGAGELFVIVVKSLLLVSFLFCNAAIFGQSLAGTRADAPPTSGVKAIAAISNGVGCGLPEVLGKSGTSVLFVPVESRVSEPLRHVSWSVGAKVARYSRISGARILSALPGSGDGVWFAVAQRGGDLHVYRLGSGDVLRADGTIHPEGTATTMSWAQDGIGGVWLFLETVNGDRRFIEAFRKESSKWRAKGIVVVGNLLTPRGIPGESSVICGQWVFSAEGPPRRIPVEGQPDLAETYPGRDGRLTELSLSDHFVRSSDDGGLHWILAPTPWRAATQFTWAPESIDRSGDAPTIRWVADGRLVIMRFSGGRWRTVLDASVEHVHGLGGPAVTIGSRLVLFADCYRIAPGEADSIRIGVVDHGSVHVSTVKVLRPVPFR